MAGTIENLRPFKPGQSGNPGGRKRGNSVSSVLNRLLDEESTNSPGKTRAENVAAVIVREAEAGDVRFVEMLLQRTEGKVPDKIQVTERVIRVEYADGQPDSDAPETAQGSGEDSPGDEEV